MEEVLINSWWFNFRTMTANRDLPSNYGSRNYWDTVCPFSINNGVLFRSPYGGGFIPDFFCEPKDHYNDDIVRAYNNYVFERDVLK